jgi:hypothetical protein
MSKTIEKISAGSSPGFHMPCSAIYHKYQAMESPMRKINKSVLSVAIIAATTVLSAEAAMR